MECCVDIVAVFLDGISEVGGGVPGMVGRCVLD